MFQAIKKISNICIVLGIGSAIIVNMIYPNIRSSYFYIPGFNEYCNIDFKFYLLLLICVNIAPIIFVCMAVALRKIVAEMANESTEVMKRINDLENQIENLSK